MKKSAHLSHYTSELNDNLRGLQLAFILLLALSFARATNHTVSGQSFSWARYTCKQIHKVTATKSIANSFALISYK